ncbi:contractile injection system protein, VgrG/Pvc8 family [Aeromonas tecta]|uniref:contractile injection system protein, VgrG/Pvc8 family n=1 Tax=Aeromonas tecta TaxID=324617 RepID=UPI001E30E2F4|nr:contractile injection system protein, VgrG/Pvc8 family [Aeromonas tecta]
MPWSTEVEHNGAPDVLTIRGKSADLRDGMNKLRERSWHQTIVSSIVDQVAAPYKLTPCVGDSLKGQLIDHIDQTNESDLAFLTRLTGQCDAITTVKSGRLMFIKAGQGTTASGQPLPAITITRQDGDLYRFRWQTATLTPA